VTEVKVCGLTRPQDVEQACALGASFVGLNFSVVSPRRVTLETARRLAAASAPGVRRVGVFVGESYEEILAAIEAARLDLVQLHRPLREEDLEKVPRPIIAVARIANTAAQLPAPPFVEKCHALLLDTDRPGSAGGTGERFDWRLLEGRTWPVPVFLAGGLTPENVGEGIRRARPAAVDVASGVESAPGIKDPERMRDFFEAVRQADLPLPPGEACPPKLPPSPRLRRTSQRRGGRGEG